MPSDASSAGYGTLVMLMLLIGASVWLGTVAQRVVERGSFVKGYFLGNRGLGAWALALTATVQSGGTFMGFPSLVYTHGWIVALWIAGYMVVPITGFGVLGKRLAQLSRRTGAITVPDLFRERFASPAVGLTAMLFILLYMSFMMVAQFKAGALIMKVSWPGSGALALTEDAGGGYDRYYYIGLSIFAATVVGYTLIGGFLAAVWTDLFQSIMMFFGVVMLFVLALRATGGIENATRGAVDQLNRLEPKLRAAAERQVDDAVAKGAISESEAERRREAARGRNLDGDAYALGPGFAPDGRTFLPLGLAFSFFFTWVYAGMGSPASIVRVMASKSTEHIRRSIFLLNSYNAMIYVPLVVICICGRSLIPDLPAGKTDEVIPRLTVKLTEPLPAGSLLAGLVLTAPFGAVMATVSGYLVVIASALVRDVYQRFVRPDASATEIRRLTYVIMIVVGLIAFAANLKPVAYLQAIVVFSGSGGASTFVVPALMAAYWRRATTAGTLAAMIAGGGTLIGLYVTGFVLPGYDPLIGQVTKFRPYFLLGLDPIVWGLSASLVAGIAVSLITSPPRAEHISRLFDAQLASA